MIIDPMVEIDPNWMVDYNGNLVPGSQLYSVAFSNEFRPGPLPGAVWLLGSGLLGLVGWRRFKKG